MEIDEEEAINITPDDQSWDLVKMLRKSLPGLRNELAHGSSKLTNQVLGTIELVAEILSQIYALDSGTTVSEASQD
ncbi:hypothetical protein [Cupriavidus campinensis]|uniref:Uncharacterized protein n=1 Tax=Cupriavidus campinensis TaxID=151783 RepID=A0AAE9I0H9_9BURK|nr:hypothetical protein [Cupriavidus campinensis]URF04115.1 hypothetical protein M5D45_16820 [Cupriavidus campinensis]